MLVVIVARVVLQSLRRVSPCSTPPLATPTSLCVVCNPPPPPSRCCMAIATLAPTVYTSRHSSRGLSEEGGRGGDARQKALFPGAVRRGAGAAPRGGGNPINSTAAWAMARVEERDRCSRCLMYIDYGLPTATTAPTGPHPCKWPGTAASNSLFLFLKTVQEQRDLGGQSTIPTAPSAWDTATD